MVGWAALGFVEPYAQRAKSYAEALGYGSERGAFYQPFEHGSGRQVVENSTLRRGQEGYCGVA
jgi:hypothetical protein